MMELGESLSERDDRDISGAELHGASVNPGLKRSEDRDYSARLANTVAASVERWRRRQLAVADYRVLPHITTQIESQNNGRLAAAGIDAAAHKAVSTPVTATVTYRPVREGQAPSPQPSGNGRSRTGQPLALPHVAQTFDPEAPGMLANLPRRPFLSSHVGETTPPKMRFTSVKAGRGQALRRLVVWLGVLWYMASGTLVDHLRRRDTTQRRAARLRRALERAGGTFVKIGHDMAMRVDFLPWEYSVELSGIVDKVRPFPTAQAIDRIEKATRRPLEQTFSQFDPVPIVSSSVACVYQAVMHDGTKVAIKVRRPGIGQLFMADLTVLDWVLKTVEFLTLLRPGMTQNMRRQLREIVLEELDFIQEARHQDLFRRAAKKSGKGFFTAPRVFLAMASEDVMIEEFTGGIWLWELLAALEQNDAAVLDLARRLKIEPRKVAQRLAWVNYWGWDQHLFFHADPHPDNIIIGPNSKLIFLDFSAVGAIDRTKRRALEQNMYYIWKKDPLNMARSSLALLEPLPPLDVIEFTKELEVHNWQLLYTLESRKSTRSPQSAWLDRTTARQWLGVLEVTRRHDIVIDSNVVRLLKAIILYEGLAARLDPQLDIIKEYRRYQLFQAKQGRKRVTRSMARRMLGRRDNRVYMQLERILNTGEGLFFRIRHSLEIPRVNYNLLMSKWSYAVLVFVKFLAQITVISALAVGAAMVQGYLAQGGPPDILQSSSQVVTNRWFQLLVVLLILINGRNVLFRMDDKEIQG